MTEWISERRICCPFCGQSMTVVIDGSVIDGSVIDGSVFDGSAGSQSYIEDCEICCQPMQISVHVSVETDDAAMLVVEVDRAD